MSLPSSMADFVPCDRLFQKAYKYQNDLLTAFALGFPPGFPAERGSGNDPPSLPHRVARTARLDLP